MPGYRLSAIGYFRISNAVTLSAARYEVILKPVGGLVGAEGTQLVILGPVALPPLLGKPGGLATGGLDGDPGLPTGGHRDELSRDRAIPGRRDDGGGRPAAQHAHVVIDRQLADRVATEAAEVPTGQLVVKGQGLAAQAEEDVDEAEADRAGGPAIQATALPGQGQAAADLLDSDGGQLTDGGVDGCHDNAP